jgi:hypothetical protein
MSIAISAIRGISIKGLRGGQAFCVVTDALQFPDDEESRGDDPEIGSHRLLGRDEQQCTLLQRVAPFVDRAVVLDHFLRQLRVIALERLDRAFDCLFHHATQIQEVLAEQLEVTLEFQASTRCHVVFPFLVRVRTSPDRREAAIVRGTE